MQQHLKKKRTENQCQTTKTTEKGVYGCAFLPTYREALCDRNFYIEEKDSGSESCTDSDGLLGIAEHTAHTTGDQVCNPHKARLNLSKSFFVFVYFILMMSMPVTVRLTWSPAAAQSRGSSCRVIPATRPSKSHCRHKVAVFHTALSPCEETRLRILLKRSWPFGHHHYALS